MDISTAGMNQLMLDESVNASRDGLVRIAIFICWESLSVGVAKLATCSSSPGVQLTAS